MENFNELVESLRDRSEAFDDGYIPPLFRDKPEQSRVVRHPSRQLNLKNKDNMEEVFVIDNALPSDLVQQIYDVTMSSDEPAWGTYVTMNEAKSACACDNHQNQTNDFHDLATRAVHYFLRHVNQHVALTSPSSSSSSSRLYKNVDMLGVGVWWLASEVGSRGVAYHMDYAELVRYEHNLIVPPLFGAVLHCSDADLDGGDFIINTQGLEHYRKFGYKKKNYEASFHTDQISDDCSYWKEVSYKFNRLTIFNGEYPHMSTKLNSLPGAHKIKRVIMGFNVFSSDVGPLVEDAPEHSLAFKTRVRMHQQNVLKNKNQNSANGLSIERIKSIEGLSKLLVLAKREHVKKMLLEEQHRVRSAVVEILLTNNKQTIRVRHLIDEISCKFQDICSTDIHVHINSMSKTLSSKEFQVKFVSDGPCGFLYDDCGLISLSAICITTNMN